MIITQTFPEKSGLAHDIKMRNIRNIMLYLLAYGEMTKLDILLHSALSTTTVSDLINNLLKLHIVQTTGTLKSTGGRQPTLYSINNRYGFFLGITIEKNRLDIAVTDMYARPLQTEHLPIAENLNPLYAVYNAIDSVLANRADQSLLALGLGISGELDVNRGIVRTSQQTEWKNVPIKEILERRFNTLVFVDNAVNQGAMYQQVLGKARHMENFVCYFSKYPKQGALVLNGLVCRGKQNTCLSLNDTAPVESIACLSSMVGLDAILTDQSDLLQDGCVQPLHVSDTYFETAAALVAEVYWFEQIYAMHSKSMQNEGVVAK